MDNAKMFYEEFVAAISEKCSLEEYRRGGSAFTEIVMGIIGDIIENPKKMGMVLQKEYYRIDAIGWRDRKKEINEEATLAELNPHLWDLEVAVEHENNRYDWTDELIKLIHIRCPLKIIIGYNCCDQRQNEEREKLRVAAEWMQMVKAYDANAKENYLIIFGNAASKSGKHTYDSFGYVGYLYDHTSKEFRNINE